MIEHKYERIAVPLLKSLASHAVRSFLKADDRYAKLRKADAFQPVSLLDCVDDGLKDAIALRHAGAVKYPEERAAYQSVTDYLDELKSQKMDETISDVCERMTKYDMEFMVVRDLGRQWSLKSQF